MKISVLISTFDRCDSLKDTLHSLANQKYDGSFDYEIIIIDNNSQDKTKEVVESFRNVFKKNVLYFFEPRQGKTFALNLGIKNSSGDILAFTDDDVVLDNSWLLEIYKTFRNFDAGIAGGVINPIWLSPKPNWLTDKFFTVLGIQNYGENSFCTDSNNRLPFGANYAFKRVLFNNYGLFNEKMPFSQDTEICIRFLNKGTKFAYNPKIIVHHKINPQFLNKKHFLRWNYYRGKLTYKLEKKRLFNILQGISDKLFSIIWCWLKNDSENSFYHETKLIYYIGQLKGMLNATKRG